MDEIKITSEKIWEILGEEGEVSVVRLPELVGTDSVLIQFALNWLAQQHKIYYLRRNFITYVALVDAERSLFIRCRVLS